MRYQIGPKVWKIAACLTSPLIKLIKLKERNSTFNLNIIFQLLDIVRHSDWRSLNYFASPIIWRRVPINANWLIKIGRTVTSVYRSGYTVHTLLALNFRKYRASSISSIWKTERLSLCYIYIYSAIIIHISLNTQHFLLHTYTCYN